MALKPDLEFDPYEPLFGPVAEARNTPEELMRKRRAALAAIDARTVGIKPDLTDEGMSDYALLSDPRNVQLRKDFEHLLEPNGLDRDGKPLGAANQTLRPNALQSNLDQAQAFGDQLTVGRYTNPLSPQHARGPRLASLLEHPEGIRTMPSLEEGEGNPARGGAVAQDHRAHGSPNDEMDVAVRIFRFNPREKPDWPGILHGGGKGSRWFQWGQSTRAARHWSERIAKEPQFRKEIIDKLQNEGVTRKHLQEAYNTYMWTARQLKGKPSRFTPIYRGNGLKRLMKEYPDTLPSGVVPLESQDKFDEIFGLYREAI